MSKSKSVFLKKTSYLIFTSHVWSQFLSIALSVTSDSMFKVNFRKVLLNLENRPLIILNFHSPLQQSLISNVCPERDDFGPEQGKR